MYVHSVQMQACRGAAAVAADIGGQGHPDASPTPLLLLQTWNIPKLLNI